MESIVVEWPCLSQDETPRTNSSDLQVRQELNIPWHAIVRGLSGVAVATKAADGEAERIADAITPAMVKGAQESLNLNLVDSAMNENHTALPLHDWHAHITTCALEQSQHHRATLALTMAFLCLAGRQAIPVQPADLDFVWSLVHEALTSPSIPYTISRSAQGFLAVPLWSLIKDGNIDELFRLHVWLPDGKRGFADAAVHSHQAFAQSWILTGEGRDHSFDVYPVAAADSTNTATHAEFSLSWSDSSGKATGKTYQTHQKSSTVVNTGNLVCVTAGPIQPHARNASYSVPAGAFHWSEVPPDALHATLFFFDSHRGFQKIAPVLGPVHGAPYTQQREVVGTTPAALAGMVQSMRAWEETLRGDEAPQHLACGNEREDMMRADEPVRRCVVHL